MRLFVGIKLKKEIKDIIYSYFKNLPKCYKITKLDNLHITLFFLGEVEEVFIPEIINKIKFAIRDHSIIKVSLDSIGQFPQHGKPRIIYISGKKGEKELTALASLIKENLIDFKQDKNKIEEFKFHITVARLNERERSLPYKDKIPQLKEEICFDVEQIALLKSELKPDGPIYTELWSGALLPIY